MSLPTKYSQYIFSERPTGDLTPTTFKQETKSLSDAKPGKDQVLVKVTWLSLDPAMRSWLNDNKRAYTAPVKLGEVMRALGLGVVVQAGADSSLKVGDEVSGTFGWTEFALMKSKDCTKLTIPQGAEALDYLGVLGPGGLTAYFGLFDVGGLSPEKKDQTLVVSGAAGSVGSVACQLGLLTGYKVVAIAGGAEKCKWLKEEVGVHLALDYKSPTFHEDYKRDAGFADVYFDNVGGEILNFIMTRMAMKGRIVFCGAISDYNAKPKGLTSYMSMIAQRIRMEGFVIFDYVPQFPEAVAKLAGWIAEGKIRRKFHVVDGLESAPKALPMLYSGGNTGKLVVKVAQEPAKL